MKRILVVCLAFAWTAGSFADNLPYPCTIVGGAAASAPRDWNRDLVIEAIQMLEANGIRPNSNILVNVKDADVVRQIRAILKHVTGRDIGGGQLVQVAKRLFPSWPDAVRAAGLDPDATRTSKREFWTDDTIIASIRHVELHGTAHVSYVSKDPQGRVLEALTKLWGRPVTGAALRRAAELRYGSWDAALTAAGFDPAKIKRTFKWSKDDVVLAIQAFYDHGLDLNASAFNDPRQPPSRGVWIDSPYHRVLEKVLGQRVAGWSLHGAAKRYFGDWDTALRAAGFDPRVERARMKWDKDLVIKAIKELNKNGVHVNSAYVQRALDSNAVSLLEGALGRRVSLNSLHNAALRHFGQWDQALRAAGLNPQHIRLRFWARGRLSTVPHQKEDYQDSDGNRRTQRLVGRREPSPEENIRSKEFEEALTAAISGVPLADRPILTHIVDVIMASDRPPSPADLAQSASAELGKEIPIEKIRSLLQHLADSDALKDLN